MRGGGGTGGGSRGGAFVQTFLVVCIKGAGSQSVSQDSLTSRP
jgi:hypothetical protein